jgi:hypothetical protein
MVSFEQIGDFPRREPMQHSTSFLQLVISGALLLTVAQPVPAANGQYCDEPNAEVNCLDPTLNPASPIGAGTINPDVTVITPGESIDLADDGAYDGIYACTVTDPGFGKSAAYVSVNGHASGEMIFVLAGLDPNTDLYAGYGKGKFVGTTLTGTTSRGGAFSFHAAMSTNATGAAQATLGGTVRIKGRDLTLKAVEYDAQVDCVSIW